MVTWVLATIIVVLSIFVLAYASDLRHLHRSIESPESRSWSFSRRGRKCRVALSRLRLGENNPEAECSDSISKVRMSLAEYQLIASRRDWSDFRAGLAGVLAASIRSDLVCLIEIGKPTTGANSGSTSAPHAEMWGSVRLPEAVRRRIEGDVFSSTPLTNFGDHPKMEPLVRPIGLGGALIQYRALVLLPPRKTNGAKEFLWIGFTSSAFSNHMSSRFLSTCGTIAHAELEARRSVESTQRTLEESQDRMREATVRVARVAHDIRSPISSIEGVFDLLKSGQGTLELSELIEIGKQSCQYVKQMSGELILAGKEEHKEAVPSREASCEALSIVEAVVSAHGEVVGGNVELVSRLENGRTIYAAISAVDFRRIVENLVSNAIKFGEGRRIRVEVGESSHWLLMSVRDAGTGIADSDVLRIFDPFERLATNKPGFGLGLASVKALVSTYGGKIRVESKVGIGALFEVQLPLASHGREVSASDTAVTLRRTDSLPNQLVILDDNRDLAESLVRVLAVRGISARGFTDPAASIEFIATHNCSRILTDFQMPSITASAFINRVKEVAPDAQVAVMSGALSDDDAYSLAAAGVTEFFIKPVELDRLSAWIVDTRMLELSRAA